MNKMALKNYLRLTFKEFFYLVVTVVFLVKLDQLNEVLTSSEYINDTIGLLSYHNYLPLWYFGGALVLVTVGVLLIVFKINRIRDREVSCGEIVISCITILAVAILIIMLIVFIDNPILRAILTVLGVIVAGGYLITQ